MGKVSARGSFQLFVGSASSTIIMAVGSVIFIRLMSPDEYGLYSIALIPSLMINLFRDWGVGTAMAKYIAQFKASNNVDDINDIVAAGLIFEIAAGLALSFLSLLMASFIASSIFHRPELSSLISIVSITIFSNALLTAAQSSFIGFERMEFNSLTMLCQAVVKSSATPILVFLGYGALGATLGYTFSFLAAGIIGLVLLYYFVFVRNLKIIRKSRSQVFETLRMMLHYGVPFSISSILLGFMFQFYGFMMASFCSNLMIGNYQSAVQFSVILSFVTSPVATVLFPAFAKINPQNEPKLLETAFVASVKFTTLLLMPATMAMIVLSKPMIYTLFGDKWVYAPFFLTLYIIGNMFSGIGNLSMGSFLAGRGETKLLLKQSLITLLSGIPLALLLIPPYGIVGVILGNFFASLPSMFWGLHWIWKRYHVKADFKSTAKIFIASLLAGAITHLSLNLFEANELITLVLGGIVFFAAYIIFAPLAGALTLSDINTLRTMFSGLGFVSKLINLPLSLIEKVTVLCPRR